MTTAIANQNDLVNNCDKLMNDISFRLEVVRSYQKSINMKLAGEFNVFKLMNPNENTLSDVLADMLRPDGTHGQGDVFLKLFLSRLGFANHPSTVKINVRREVPTNNILNSERRIDILTDFGGQYGIGIENKPWAADLSNQVGDYCSHLDKLYGDKYMFVYLPPYDRDPDNGSLHKLDLLKQRNGYCCLSYNSGLKNWMEDCLKECKADKYRWFLQNFIEYVENEF
ncbi:MAG: hypothetical protein H6Q66_2003 [Firmicutes bacterium]|nr:hypothetical protein [Bacillota bacterium]